MQKYYTIKLHFGFTLIELLITVVILGILSATVLPKFIDFSADARTSTIERVQVHMQGAAAKVHRKAIVRGVQNLPETVSGANTTVDVDDRVQNFPVHFGFPRANAADWQSLLQLDLDDYRYTNLSDNTIAVSRTDTDVPVNIHSTCMVAYTQAASGVEPTYNLNECAD